MAKNRVEFRDHLFVYAIVNCLLFAINMWSSRGVWWFLFPLFFWGIGLLFHYRDAYYGGDRVRIEKEYQKLRKQAKRK